MTAIMIRQRARLASLGVLAVYLGTVAELGHARWGRLGVPVSTFRFYDLRNVTSAWECTRRGIAVLPVNPCDPSHRPADFPRIWLSLSFLGLGPADTIVLGFVLGGVFLAAAIFVLPADASIASGLFYALMLCSPAVMLGVERGNPDIVLFVIMLAAVLVGSRSRARETVGALLVLLAAVLKFYPVFAIGFLVRRATRTSLLAAGLVALVFLVYAALIHSEIHQILASVPQSSEFAYGVRRVTLWTAAAALAGTGHFGWYRPWDVVLLLAGVGVAWMLGRRLRARLAPPAAHTQLARELDLLWAGACIYVGSYAIFISNDYRLVFLLFVVPQVWRWTVERHFLAFITVPALLGTLWLDDWTQMPALGHLMNWWARLSRVGPGAATLPVALIAQYALFAALAGWLFATAPPLSQLRATVRSAIGRSPQRAPRRPAPG